jgi:hypothetical protein
LFAAAVAAAAVVALVAAVDAVDVELIAEVAIKELSYLYVYRLKFE